MSHPGPQTFSLYSKFSRYACHGSIHLVLSAGSNCVPAALPAVSFNCFEPHPEKSATSVFLVYYDTVKAIDAVSNKKTYRHGTGHNLEGEMSTNFLFVFTTPFCLYQGEVFVINYIDKNVCIVIFN